MSDFKLRAATKSDAADLTMLENIAGHGISLWFWQQHVDGGFIEDALAFGRRRLMQPNAFYGISSATVATRIEDGDEIILGCVTSYVMEPVDDDMEDVKRNAPALNPLFELFDEAKGDWTVDSMAVYPEARGLGLGAKLLDVALDKGKGKGLAQTSLIVEDSNEAARALYRSRGFEQRDSRPFVEFRGPSETKHWLLLSRPFG